jgi:flagellar FliJ protein
MAKGLALVIELAKGKQQEAGELLASAQAQLARAEEQLQQLSSYRAEYQQRFQQNSGRGVSIHSLLDGQQFMQQLDKAISAQADEVFHKENLVAQARSTWQDAARYRQSLEQYHEQQLREAAQKREKREQRLLEDTYVARQFMADLED